MMERGWIWGICPRNSGRRKSKRLGRIRAYEELLHRTPRPEAELAAMTVDELRSLAEALRANLSRG